MAVPRGGAYRRLGCLFPATLRRSTSLEDDKTVLARYRDEIGVKVMQQQRIGLDLPVKAAMLRARSMEQVKSSMVARRRRQISSGWPCDAISGANQTRMKRKPISKAGAERVRRWRTGRNQPYRRATTPLRSGATRVGQVNAQDGIDQAINRII